VLKALAPITGEGLSTRVVRGQYIAGYSDGKPVPGYLEEDNANAQSDTETFVALRADIRNWRWSGVPFYLRTGKRMPQKLSQIVIHFKEPPHYIFAPEQRLADQQQADHPPATGRRHFAAGDDQGAGPGQGHATAQWPAATEFLRHLAQRADSGCLRAVVAGSDARQSEPVRAQGRNRSRLEVV
jgi:hypothetical protein